jgi:hypothetical protein
MVGRDVEVCHATRDLMSVPDFECSRAAGGGHFDTVPGTALALVQSSCCGNDRICRCEADRGAVDCVWCLSEDKGSWMRDEEAHMRKGLQSRPSSGGPQSPVLLTTRARHRIPMCALLSGRLHMLGPDGSFHIDPRHLKRIYSARKVSPPRRPIHVHGLSHLRCGQTTPRDDHATSQSALSSNRIAPGKLFCAPPA